MLYGDLTEGYYDFLGGSEADVHTKSYQMLTLERGKWASVRYYCLLQSVLLYLRQI